MNETIATTALKNLKSIDGKLRYLMSFDGVTAENVKIPENVSQWFASISNEVETASHLYLVKLNGQYGIMAINKYGWCSADGYFCGNKSAMRERTTEIAERLSEYLPYNVFYGIETNINGSDEMAIFIPLKTAKEKVANVLRFVDASAYTFF